MTSLDIHNRGELVGQLVDAMPEMWYLEGRFVPAPGEAGARFTKAASNLDVRKVYDDPTKGIRIAIRESSDNSGTLAIVLSLSQERLLVRRVFEQKAINWVNENVSE